MPTTTHAPIIGNKLKLKATFRNNINNYKHIYKKNSAILLISPTQPYYKNEEKFNAIIQLINNTQFKHCHIIVGDTNYQHTLKIAHPSPQVAYSLAAQIGSDWIKANEKIYNSLKMPFTLTRWEEWVNQDRYSYHRNKLDLLFNSDLDFKNSFINTALEFIHRNSESLNINNFNHEYAIECCLEYLKEECAIIMPLWAEMNHPFIIYPSKMLMAMEATYQKLVVPYYSTKPHWLSIRFASKIDKPIAITPNSHVTNKDYNSLEGALLIVA